MHSERRRSSLIYDTPIFRPLGDCYLGVEFGDEADVLLSFRVLALRSAIEAESLPGVVEIQPTVRQLALVLDRSRTTHAKLRDAVEALLPAAEPGDALPSRLVRLPVWYDDPWSAEIARQYGVQNNLEFVADQNGLTPDEAIARHMGTDYWIGCVGFTPGSYLGYALDTSKVLTAPTYPKPRSHTPARMICINGATAGAYPVASPGGAQIIGRLAVNIYESPPRNAAFPSDGVLLRASDRIRYLSVNALEYEEIWDQVQSGKYDYEIADEVFDIKDYLKNRPARGVPQSA